MLREIIESNINKHGYKLNENKINGKVKRTLLILNVIINKII